LISAFRCSRYASIARLINSATGAPVTLDRVCNLAIWPDFTEYMTREELVRLFRVARQHSPLHHVAMLVGLLHGLRVSETLAIRGCDICDGKLSVKRLKKSRATLHALRIDRDVLFDESPLLELSKANPDSELFPWSRQYTNKVEDLQNAATHPCVLIIRRS
jgi:integrase